MSPAKKLPLQKLLFIDEISMVGNTMFTVQIYNRLNPFPSDRAIWHTRVPPLKFPSVPYGTLHIGQL